MRNRRIKTEKSINEAMMIQKGNIYYGRNSRKHDLKYKNRNTSLRSDAISRQAQGLYF